MAKLEMGPGTLGQIRLEERDHLAHDVLFEVPDPPRDSSLVLRNRPGLYGGAKHYEGIWIDYTPGLLGMVRACINNKPPHNPYTIGSLARAVAEGCGQARYTCSASKGANQFVYATPGGYVVTRDPSQVPRVAPCIEISDARKQFRTLWPIAAPLSEVPQPD